jgi:hypothetical protein
MFNRKNIRRFDQPGKRTLAVRTGFAFTDMFASSPPLVWHRWRTSGESSCGATCSTSQFAFGPRPPDNMWLVAANLHWHRTIILNDRMVTLL